MTFPQFADFLEGLVSEMRNMASTKGKEYARSDDRFDNFNRLAARLNLPREKVGLVYLTKHLDAIESYIDSHREYSEERIRGRCVDAMLYIALLAGMFEDNQSGQGNVGGAL